MSNKVEKGKDISVLVEQAFPTCILVSFQHGDKTFRGVLLDESCQSSVIRATPSDVLGKAENSANLGLTTSRATTCQSDLSHLPGGRVSTRSSTMMLRDDKGESGTERITPVHKIKGLVKRLTQRPRKLAPTPQPSSTSPADKGGTLKEVEKVHPGMQQSLYETKGNRNLKRKRVDQNDTAFLKAAKTTHEYDNIDTLKPPKNDGKTVAMEQGNLSSSSMCGKSPLFPVLKLRKTSSLDNSYVAVTVFSSVETNLRDEQKGTDKLESTTGTITETPPTSQDAIHHKHNTRFKARKTGTQMQPTQVEPEDKLNQTCNNSTIKKEKIPNVLTEKNIVAKPDYCNPAIKAILPSHTKRQLNKRMIHRNMNIGDIAWGKVHGHPWWPCRVLGIKCSGAKLDESHQILNVSWYGSPTTSDISCKLLLTFKEHFKHLYKKQKKGAYQLAVKQAQHDLDLSFSDATQVMPV